MNNLWILTEEVPKPDTILQIILLLSSQYNYETNQRDTSIKITPMFDKDIFTFRYSVIGVEVSNIESIYIEIVDGKSSFFDYLLFVQEDRPISGQLDGLLMAIEETKTTDGESRNTGVYQRGTKFVYIEKYTTSSNLYMMYGYSQDSGDPKKVSDTNIFGTRLLSTLGVKFEGKENVELFPPFKNIEELPPHVMDEICHFFTIYKALEGQETAVMKIEGRDVAIDVITKGIAEYKSNFYKLVQKH